MIQAVLDPQETGTGAWSGPCLAFDQRFTALARHDSTSVLNDPKNGKYLLSEPRVVGRNVTIGIEPVPWIDNKQVINSYGRVSAPKHVVGAGQPPDR